MKIHTAQIDRLENLTFDEIEIGQSATLARILTVQDIQDFAKVSGDVNPAHLNPEYAKTTIFKEIIGHGMFEGALVSTVLGTIYPGPGTIYLSQTLHFKRPVKVGDTLTVLLTTVAKDVNKKTITLSCEITNQHGIKVLEGEAMVIPPSTKVNMPRQTADVAHKIFDPEERVRAFLETGAHLEAVKCGVVHPCDEDSLKGAVMAAQANLIIPILIGPEAKIKAVAKQYGLDINPYKIIPTEHSHESSEVGATMAAAGEVEILMKGSLHTDELLHAVISNKSLRTKRRLSHISRFELPLYPKPILLTDAAININPTLLEKADIIQNAITLSHILGNLNPKVAILSAVETVNTDLTSTLDAAILCKMADRGQIFGGILDGPLAFDNAISPHSVRIKGIKSEVAGDADILVVEDVESGNFLMKAFDYFSGAVFSGVVLGCKVPIALTSRADDANSKMSSVFLAKLVAHNYRIQKP